MKSIRIAGLCLVAMFAVSMVAAGTASAAPVWEHCEKGASGTKYETGQCRKVGTTNEFGWQEVKGTEAVRSHGSLLLTDTKVPIAGEVSVSCSGANVGFVGPGKFDRITEITEIRCVPDKNCEKIEKEVEPRNLPWQTEVVEEGGETRDLIRATDGEGAGWAVTCKVLGITDTDVCTTEEGSTSLANVLTPGVAGELLVLAKFEAKSAKATCSLKKEKSGEVKGSIANLQANGQALRIS